MFAKILNVIKKFIQLIVSPKEISVSPVISEVLSPMEEKTTLQIPKIESTVETLGEKIYRTSKGHIGQYLTLDNRVPKELDCAEAVSYVLYKSGVKDILPKGFTGTYTLWVWLKLHAEEITNPSPGDIVLCPSGTSTKGYEHGHVGIVGKEWIMSNDSSTGLFQANYNFTTWKNYFADKLGFPIFYFRLK